MYTAKREYFIQHHGIQGQKWGVRNGPPYPLDAKTANKVKKQVQRISKAHKKYSYTSSREHAIQATKTYSEITSRENVLTAKKELEEVNKLFEDYNEDRDEWVREYAKLMKNNLEEFGLEWTQNDSDPEYNWRDSDYLYSAYDHDGDSSINSFTVYLYKNGKDVDSLAEKYIKDRDNYSKAVSESITEILGDYKDLSVKDYRYGGREKLGNFFKEAAEEPMTGAYFYLTNSNEGKVNGKFKKLKW